MTSTPRPNILLITTDQQRGDCLGINGHSFLETPYLDAMAAPGVNFNRAYVTCPVCIPARRTLISGLSPDTHGLRGFADGLDFDPPQTLPGCLREAGYQTQLIGKLHLHPQGKRYGYDNMILSDMSHWRPKNSNQTRNDYVRWLQGKGVTEHPHSHGVSNNGRLSRPWGMEENLHHSTWLVQEAIHFLSETKDPSTPFFLHLSFSAPHPPLVPVSHYFERYLAKNLPGATLGEWSPTPQRCVRHPDSATGPFDPEVIRRATAAYYALINQVDDLISSIFEQWFYPGSPDARAPLYVLFSSDHGEMLGDHQLFRKSLGYEASARVPFFITGYNVPPIQAGITDQLVCWEDIAPTLLDLAGVPVPSSMEGTSLAPLMRGETPSPARDHIFGQCQGQHHNLWVTTKKWKYIWFPPTNEEQLFDLENDPQEIRDLSADHKEIQEMRHLLMGHVKDRKDLVFDPAQLKPCGNKPPKIFWSS